MATVYLNAATGNDANTYAQAQNPATPWLTPGKVQTSATSGDTVEVAAGTYTFASVEWTKSFTFNGAALSNGLPTTILDGGGSSVYWTMSYSMTLNRIMFKNVVHAVTWQLLSVIANAAVITCTNCVFKDIKVRNDGPLGAILGGGAGLTAAYTINVTNCLFQDILRNGGSFGAIFSSYSGIGTFNVNNCNIYNVTPGVNALTHMFYMNGAGHTVTLKNVVVYNVTGGTFTYVIGTLTTTASYSDFYLLTGAPTGTGVITSDPLFIDTANANFNLRPTSPCLDTGVII